MKIPFSHLHLRSVEYVLVKHLRSRIACKQMNLTLILTAWAFKKPFCKNQNKSWMVETKYFTKFKNALAKNLNKLCFLQIGRYEYEKIQKFQNGAMYLCS
jgi:hypothetical protein